MRDRTQSTPLSLKLLAVLLIGLAISAGGAVAATSGGTITIVPVAGALNNPVGATNAGDGSGRLFIAAAGRGRSRIWNGTQLLPRRSSTSAR